MCVLGWEVWGERGLRPGRMRTNGWANWVEDDIWYSRKCVLCLLVKWVVINWTSTECSHSPINCFYAVAGFDFPSKTAYHNQIRRCNLLASNYASGVVSHKVSSTIRWVGFMRVVLTDSSNEEFNFRL